MDFIQLVSNFGFAVAAAAAMGMALWKIGSRLIEAYEKNIQAVARCQDSIAASIKHLEQNTERVELCWQAALLKMDMQLNNQKEMKEHLQAIKEQSGCQNLVPLEKSIKAVKSNA